MPLRWSAGLVVRFPTSGFSPPITSRFQRQAGVEAGRVRVTLIVALLLLVPALSPAELIRGTMSGSVDFVVFAVPAVQGDPAEFLLTVDDTDLEPSALIGRYHIGSFELRLPRLTYHLVEPEMAYISIGVGSPNLDVMRFDLRVDNPYGLSSWPCYFNLAFPKGVLTEAFPRSLPMDQAVARTFFVSPGVNPIAGVRVDSYATTKLPEPSAAEVVTLLGMFGLNLARRVD